MAKILLVEDDNNLREIYAARLMTGGHEILSAKDGEEGLAIAAAERPDLIITDAMMPKVSGLQFLDILRSTPQTANIKVIAMTALSQAEDRTQFEKLGVERFLVKSQVTLEDVARVVDEVLNPAPAAPEVQPGDNGLVVSMSQVPVSAPASDSQRANTSSQSLEFEHIRFSSSTNQYCRHRRKPGRIATYGFNHASSNRSAARTNELTRS